jgi:hypothetical protein
MAFPPGYITPGLRDDDFLAVFQDFIEETQTLRFELTRCNLLDQTVVIIPWSLRG